MEINFEPINYTQSLGSKWGQIWQKERERETCVFQNGFHFGLFQLDQKWTQPITERERLASWKWSEPTPVRFSRVRLNCCQDDKWLQYGIQIWLLLPPAHTHVRKQGPYVSAKDKHRIDNWINTTTVGQKVFGLYIEMAKFAHLKIGRAQAFQMEQSVVENKQTHRSSRPPLLFPSRMSIQFPVGGNPPVLTFAPKFVFITPIDAFECFRSISSQNSAFSSGLPLLLQMSF